MRSDNEWFRRIARRWEPDGGPPWEELLRGEILALARSLPAPLVLDVGCGLRNILSVDHAEHVGHRVGIDIDSAARANPGLDFFLQSDTCRIPLRSNSVDILLSGFLVEHLADPFAAFREFHRVLKPGGTAFIWAPNLFNYTTLISAITPTAFHNWVRRRAFPWEGRDNCPTFYHANTPGALVRGLRAAGLRPEGRLRFGALSYQYWRFSKPLFLAAVVGSHLVARGSLRLLMNVMLVRCLKPAT